MNKFKWKPKHNEHYYTVLACGEVIQWNNMDTKDDKNRIAIGNCFKEIGQANAVADAYRHKFKTL